MQIRWCFEHIVFLFFCNCASLHSLPPSSRGTIKVTEHVSKIYASVTNYNALSLISPLLLLRTGLVMCLPFGEAFGCEFYCVFFSSSSSSFPLSLPAYQCVTRLHICRDRRLQPKRVNSGVWLITDEIRIYSGVSLFFFALGEEEVSEWVWSRQMDGQGRWTPAHDRVPEALTDDLQKITIYLLKTKRDETLILWKEVGST